MQIAKFMGAWSTIEKTIEGLGADGQKMMAMTHRKAPALREIFGSVFRATCNGLLDAWRTVFLRFRTQLNGDFMVQQPAANVGEAVPRSLPRNLPCMRMRC